MKPMMRVSLLLIAILAFNACQQTTGPKDGQDQAPPEFDTLWQLDTDKSQIIYISTKNGDIQEHNNLRFLSGTINTEKQVQLVIDLNSIDTSIEIRDQRIRESFFETDQYPTATVNAKIANDLPLMTPYNINYTLTLRGQQQSFQSPVMIHSGGGEMMITSAESVMVSADAFGLQSALEGLREIAGLNSISDTVQVDYKLHFKQIK